MTPAEAKRFVEEARARADKQALERHGNKKLNQARQLEQVKEGDDVHGARVRRT